MNLRAYKWVCLNPRFLIGKMRRECSIYHGILVKAKDSEFVYSWGSQGSERSSLQRHTHPISLGARLELRCSSLAEILGPQRQVTCVSSSLHPLYPELVGVEVHGSLAEPHLVRWLGFLLACYKPESPGKTEPLMRYFGLQAGLWVYS